MKLILQITSERVEIVSGLGLVLASIEVRNGIEPDPDTMTLNKDLEGPEALWAGVMLAQLCTKMDETYGHAFREAAQREAANETGSALMHVIDGFVDPKTQTVTCRVCGEKIPIETIQSGAIGSCSKGLVPK